MLRVGEPSSAIQGVGAAGEGSLSPLKICLAASGGGHVRQLLDLEGAWAGHRVFYITEDTALGRSVADKHRTYFVTHVALGQGRLGRPLKMVWGGIRNFFESARAVVRERPDIVISTGAGAVFFAVLWARLIGAKFVLIDSFARFDRPSVFARVAAPLATRKIVQSAGLARFWPDAKVFDPLKVIDRPRREKKKLLFATVGATLPFDRLIRSVAKLKEAGVIRERVIMQVGVGGYIPDGMEVYETLTFDEIQELLRDANFVVCHGGTGSIVTALREGCRVVAMPRLFNRGEHYDDHQAEITGAFEARGLIGVAHTLDELRTALEQAGEREPVSATTDPVALRTYLAEFIRSVQREEA